MSDLSEIDEIEETERGDQLDSVRKLVMEPDLTISIDNANA